MSRESSGGKKALISLFITKEIISLLKQEAINNNRKISGEAEIALTNHLKGKK